MNTSGKILVIDDGTGRGKVLALWLEGKGYGCVWVKNSEQASSLLQREQFDAVVMVDEVWFPPHLRKAMEVRNYARPSGAVA